jgi:hypothetical protein
MNPWRALDEMSDEITPGVVLRHQSAGVLTWALLHQIEAEVIDEIAATGKFSKQVLRMVKSAPAFGYPTDDRPANLERHEVLPILFKDILKCWNRIH